MKKTIIEYLDERGTDLKTSFGEELIILNRTDFNEFADGLVKKLNIHDVIVPKGTLRFHLEELTKEIEGSHNYGFDDILSDYLKRNAL